jgi:photosystem II stability/assembly factor-like uncharacterized protein
MVQGKSQSRSLFYLLGGTVAALALLTGVVYLLTQWEKQKQLAREVVKPPLETTIALHEVAADMPLVFAAETEFAKEYLTAEIEEVESDAAVLEAILAGKAELGVVDVHHAMADPRLRVVAPISYAYFCGNASDPEIAPTKDLSRRMSSYELVTNLPEDSLYRAYLEHHLPGQEIRQVRIRDENQLEWRAVIRQPPGQVFFGTQPYCSQYEKYNFTTRKEDNGKVFSLLVTEPGKADGPKLPARVLVATEDTIQANGELIFRVRSALAAGSDAVYRVPTKLESSVFYRYQSRVSPEGYSLTMDWEMAYRVARSLTESGVIPRADEIAAVDPAGISRMLTLAGRTTDETQALAAVPSEELESAIAASHETAEEAYTFRYLSDEEVQEKLRRAEAESAAGVAWEEAYELKGEAKPLERLYRGPIRDHLFGVDFVDDRQGWFVGSYGTIMATSDGGQTFRPQDSGVTELLKSVFFVDERRGWVSGVDGVILHTGDGGATWTPQVSGTTEYIRDILFLDENVGFAAARASTLLATTDGGKTWTQTALQEKSDDRINRLRLIGNAIWAVGEFGSLYVRRAGDPQWQRIETGTKLTLTDIAFVGDETYVIAAIGGGLLRSTDGGRTWSTVDTATTANYYGLAPATESEAILVGDQSLVRVAAAEPQVGRHPLSIDGIDLEQSGGWLYTVTRAGDAIWGVGKQGTAVVSRDEGKTWSVVPVDPTTTVSS